MWRIVGRAVLAWFRIRDRLECWLVRRGDRVYRRLTKFAFLLLWVSNLAAPQALTPQDLETIRQQWEHRQRAEFWTNFVELAIAAALSWVVWLLRSRWMEIAKTLWKYLLVSFRVPIEIVNLKEQGENARRDLLEGQQAILARQTLLTARLQIVEDHGLVSSFVADEFGAWISLTAKMAEFVGDHPHNLIGFGWKVRIAEEDRERVMTAWTKAVKHHEPFSADFYFVSTVGKRRKVRMLAYRQLGPQGRPAGYVGQVFKIPGTGEVPPLGPD